MKRTHWILAGVLALAVVMAWPGSRVPQPVRVTQGESVRAIARDLADRHLIRSRLLFRLTAKGMRGTIRPGLYTVTPFETGWGILRQLRQGPPRIRVTLPEGWTAGQMAAALELHGVVPAKDFLAAVAQTKSDGMLFPDTYFLEQGLSPADVVGLMRKRYEEEKPKDLPVQSRKLHLSERQILILASLVEREARAPAERAVIAGVFYNRLRKHWRLESCATVQYALGNPKARLTYKDLDVPSPYNTYRHMGLPPGPIGNPGAASLQAASHPAPTDMMFFVADGTGTHRFSRYYSEHLAVQRKGRRQS